MSEIQRFWASSLHSVEPSCLTGQPYVQAQVVFASDIDALRAKYESAVRTLQDIAAMGCKAGSESAAHRLAQLGEPREAEEPPLSGLAGAP